MLPRPPLPVHRRLWLAGWALLAAGLLAAAAIWIGAAPGEVEREHTMAYRVVDGKVFPIPLDDHSPELREVMRIGGGGGAFIYRLDRWLHSLWHGRRLAATVLVLAAAASLLCFHLAGLMREGGTGDEGGGGWNAGDGNGGNGGGWGAAVRPPRHGRHRRERRRAHVHGAAGRQRHLPR